MPADLSKFMNIWEVEHHFKCPVVGAILSVEKHRNILKKCGYNVKQMKPHVYHRKIMEKLHDRNNVSMKVNNFIRNQAGRYMKQIDGMTETEIRALWRIHLEQGNVGPLMYAIVSHPDTGIELLADVSGEVHMQSHANMTEIFNVRQQLGKANEALARERKKLAEKRRDIRELISNRKSDAQRISALETENRRLVQEIGTVAATGTAPFDMPGAARKHQAELQTLNGKLDHWKRAHAGLERKIKALQIELFSAQNEKDLVRKELAVIASRFNALDQETCDGTGGCTQAECPRYRLCAKRIFMIGGITKMKAYYKDIVENAGGEFDYHDGYMRNANANLEAKVKRCDMVICPVNCNSHNACARVKKLCNRYDKQLKILSSSSLSAVTRALFTAGDHGAALN